MMENEPLFEGMTEEEQDAAAQAMFEKYMRKMGNAQMFKKILNKVNNKQQQKANQKAKNRAKNKQARKSQKANR